MEQEILTAIGQYAFPIVMCVLMGKYIKYREDQHTKSIDEMSKQHKDEMDKITVALNNNTLVIQKLTDLMEAKRNE